jgi:hypothetical protein
VEAPTLDALVPWLSQFGSVQSHSITR